MEIKDQLHRIIHLSSLPKRIVSLVPSQTELLIDLGLENQIVGITKFCVHPKHLRKNKTIVGGTKRVKVEVVKSLNPDIILCNKEENSLEILQQMQQIAPVHMSDIFRLEDSFDLINAYGKLFEVEAKAKHIIDKIKLNLQEFNRFIMTQPKLKVAYFIWREPWMIAAEQTFINHLLELNKFKNVYDNLERYPEIDLDAMCSEKKPDLIFLSSEPFPFKEKHIEEFKNLKCDIKVLLVDGEYFSWYGSRLIKAFDYFKVLRQSLA